MSLLATRTKGFYSAGLQTPFLPGDGVGHCGVASRILRRYASPAHQDELSSSESTLAQVAIRYPKSSADWTRDAARRMNTLWERTSRPEPSPCSSATSKAPARARLRKRRLCCLRKPVAPTDHRNQLPDRAPTRQTSMAWLRSASRPRLAACPASRRPCDWRDRPKALARARAPTASPPSFDAGERG